MSTTVENLIERITVKITEYPQDPWGRLEGTVYHVTAKWKEGAEHDIFESSAPDLIFGLSTNREEAISDFRDSLERRVRDIEQRRVAHEIYQNPTSIEEVTL